MIIIKFYNICNAYNLIKYVNIYIYIYTTESCACLMLHNLETRHAIFFVSDRQGERNEFLEEI